jgi:hypothetical protein
MRSALKRAVVTLGAALLVSSVATAPASAEPAALSGTITAAETGAPLAGCVALYDLQYNQVDSQCTDASGQWSVATTQSGVAYKVQFQPNDPSYKGEWAVDAASFETAAEIAAPAVVPGALVSYGDPSLTGTITSDATGEPIEGCVGVYRADTFGYGGSTCTGDATGIPGHWSLYGLEQGVAYNVSVGSWDGLHVDEWANDALTPEESADIVVPAVVDTGLTLGGWIEGKLADANGTPKVWEPVTVESTDGRTVRTPWTDESGVWRDLVRPGDYIVSFAGTQTTQYAVGALSREDAKVFGVRAGETVDASDRLIPTASVRGTITSDVDGSPVAGVCVHVLSYPVVDRPEPRGQACTDEAGAYAVQLSDPGKFIARVDDPQGRFAFEYTGGATTPEGAVPVEVVAGAPATFNASIGRGAAISGAAVDGKTDAPIEGACPSPYVGNDGGYAEGAVTECSGSDGRWTIKGLPAGSYALHLATGDKTPYVAGAWAFKATSQATADLVSVTAGKDVAIRNVKLAPGGVLTGRVLNQFGEPVQGVWVDALGNFPGRAGLGEGIYTAKTDGHGYYTVVGLPTGSYTPLVYARSDQNLAPEWSGDADQPSQATAITIKEGKTSTMDVEMGPAARLNGKILKPNGIPDDLEYWRGDVFTADGSLIGNFSAFFDGDYLSGPLPGGELTLRLTNYDGDRVVWYDAATSAADATPVSISRGEQKEVDIHLP